MRLIAASKASIQPNQEDKPTVSKNTKIYQIIHDMAEDRVVNMADAIERCTILGYTNDDIEEAIEEFENNNMWSVSKDGSRILFV